MPDSLPAKIDNSNIGGQRCTDEPSISVVINTYNRATLLSDCLRSLAQQTYSNFEIIVVCGPCTDNTEDLLENFKGDIKVAHCREINLSKSRNVGVANAAGDICAFIDDDAVAHPDWLAKIRAPYTNPKIAGVGGFTLNHTGVAFQCRYTVCDRFGNAFFFNNSDPAELIGEPGFVLYPSILGTNSSFRRSSLLTIGGFDEVFAYMLDETDVCLRLIDRGEKIATLPDALVFHRYAPSHLRDTNRIPRSLLASSRSKAYFCYKHARGQADFAAVARELDRFRNDVMFSNRWFIDRGQMEPAHFVKLNQEVDQGLAEGVGAAFATKQKPGQTKTQPPASAVFRRYPVIDRNALRICLVSQGYPPRDTAGIARWTKELAVGLAALGHRIHVVTRAERDSTVEYQEGVWVHAVRDGVRDALGIATEQRPVDIPNSILGRTAAVFREVERIRDQWGLDIISAPIWDVEGLSCVGTLGLPVVTSLHTTYRLALPYKPRWTSDPEYYRRHVAKLIAAEGWLLLNSDLILANSKAIVAEIEQAYAFTGGSGYICIVPHGVTPVSRPPKKKTATRLSSRSGTVRLLFVGRAEPRKGLDALLEAALQVMTEDGRLELDIVGAEVQGDVEYTARIAELRLDLLDAGLEKRVRFHGYVEDAELNDFYAQCDVFIVPSLFESFGLIAIEAMRHGKAIVAANVGGLAEIISDEVNGLLFAPGDVDELADCVARLARDDTLRARLSEAALRSFNENFTSAVMAERVAEAFRAAVDRFNGLKEPKAPAAQGSTAISAEMREERDERDRDGDRSGPISVPATTQRSRSRGGRSAAVLHR